MVKVSVQDDNKFSFLALIEKVAQEEIKKLSEEKLPETKSSPTLLNIKIISSTEQEPTVQHTTLLMREEEDTTKLSITTGSMNLDSETILPTNAPAIENEAMKLETMSELETKDTTESLQHRVKAPEEEATTTNSLQHDDNVKKENSASDSLLSAVGDLLSSILGVGSKKTAVVNEEQQNVIPEPDNETVDKAAERVKETVQATALVPITTTAANSLESEASSEVEQGTEKIDETATPVGFEGERIIEMETKKTVETVPVLIAVSQDKDEVELKIENLANAQTSLATENTPEQVTETVREEPSESSNNEPVVLEVISDPSTENEKPVSFEESVNQIMNLVKNSEEHVSDLMSVDDMKEDVSDLELLIYGTMKDVESNLGEDIKTETSEPVFIDLTKSLGTERSKHPFEYDNFVLNSAKAALHDRWEDDVDF